MALSVKSMTCPNCCGDMDYKEGSTFAVCPYCDSKIVVRDENEYVYHYVDETKIKEAQAEKDLEFKTAELEKNIELRKIEIAEKQREEDEKKKALKKKMRMIAILVLVGIGIISFIVGCFGNEKFYYLCGIVVIAIMFIKIDEPLDLPNQKDYYDGRIKIPSGIIGYKQKSYIVVAEMLRGAGFKNVKCVPLNDLTLGWLKKPDMVDSVTVNGDKIDPECGSNEKYSPEALVVISYHSKPGR